MDKKTVLAIVLSLVVIVVYQIFFMKPPVKQPQQAKEAQQTTGAVDEKIKPAPAPAVPAQGVPPAASVVSPKASLVAEKAAEVPEKKITVDTPLYTAVFTNKGGGLASFRLKGYRKAVAKDSDSIELVKVHEGMPAPLSFTFPGSSLDLPLASAFEASVSALDLAKEPDKRQLIFSQTFPGRLKIEKTYVFHPDRFAFDLEVRAVNLSQEPLSQSAALTWHEYVDPNAETDSYTHEGPVVYVKKDVERPEVKKMEAQATLGPDVAWGGFETKYFIAAMVPQNPSLSSILLEKDGTRNMVSVGMRGAKTVIPPGQAGVFQYTLFLGPKDYSLLKALGVQLEEAIDFGSWMKWLAMPLLLVLKFFNQYIGNYGLSIILLTIIIKIIFWPLGNKSYASMKEMQKLQPKMQALREKYKDDKQRLSQETMAMYKAHKINPLGGCLPMVIQIPVFFGLYKTLLYAIELRHSPFFGWIQDLSDKDPYYLTPIIMGGTTFLQQKMTPMGGDPMQQKIMLWMPVIFTFLFLNFPAGLVIYWLFNNIISIGQQYYINKRHA